jgi:hypothetical protein
VVPAPGRVGIVQGAEKLAQLNPDLAAVVVHAAADQPLIVAETARTPEKQAEYYAAGLSKTLNGRHVVTEPGQVAQAVDVDPAPVNYNDLEAYKQYGARAKAIARAAGLPVTWGGDWGWDYRHLQADGPVDPTRATGFLPLGASGVAGVVPAPINASAGNMLAANIPAGTIINQPREFAPINAGAGNVLAANIPAGTIIDQPREFAPIINRNVLAVPFGRGGENVLADAEKQRILDSVAANALAGSRFRGEPVQVMPMGVGAGGQTGSILQPVQIPEPTQVQQPPARPIAVNPVTPQPVPAPMNFPVPPSGRMTKTGWDPRKESEEYSKAIVKEYEKVLADANAAASNLQNLQIMQRLPVKSGALEPEKQWVLQSLDGLGIPVDKERIVNNQMFNQLVNNVQLQNAQKMKGALSDRDLQFLGQSFANLRNTPEANKLIINSNIAVAERELMKKKLYESQRAATGSFSGAPEIWQKYMESTPFMLADPRSGRPVFYHQFRDEIWRANANNPEFTRLSPDDRETYIHEQWLNMPRQ